MPAGSPSVQVGRSATITTAPIVRFYRSDGLRS